MFTSIQTTISNLCPYISTDLNHRHCAQGFKNRNRLIYRSKLKKKTNSNEIEQTETVKRLIFSIYCSVFLFIDRFIEWFFATKMVYRLAFLVY
jgi:hypothetical protein